MAEDTATCSDVILGRKWMSWCRLCAKANAEYINVVAGQNDEFNENKLKCYKDLSNVVLEFFRIHIKEDDKLPQIICKECHDVVLSLIKFSERANKVQQMFNDLQSSNNKTTNLQKLFENYGLNAHKDEAATTRGGMELQVEEIFVNDFLETTFAMPPTTTNSNVKNEKPNTNETQVEIKTSKEEKKIEFEDPIGDDEGKGFDCGTCSTPDDFSSDSEDSCMDMSLSKLKEQTKTKQKQKKTPIKKGTKKSPKKSDDDEDDGETNETISCQICTEQFKRRSNYSRHMKKKHGVFNCQQCTNAFKTAAELKKHTQEQHRKLWNCLHCEQSFERKGMRSKHMMEAHKIKCSTKNPSNSPFVCEVCGEQFVQKKQLKQHVLTHTDYAPVYSCKVCGKTFKMKYTLKKHSEIHGDKFICTECGKPFSCRATLNNHMLVHSDAMKHKCDVCGRAFKRAKTLKYHLIAHTGLRPYSCDFCGKTFSTGSSCRFHKKTMHPNELAELEASGAVAYTKNVPNLDELRAVARTGTNFRPLMSKQNGYAPKC